MNNIRLVAKVADTYLGEDDFEYVDVGYVFSYGSSRLILRNNDDGFHNFILLNHLEEIDRISSRYKTKSDLIKKIIEDNKKFNSEDDSAPRVEDVLIVDEGNEEYTPLIFNCVELHAFAASVEYIREGTIPIIAYRNRESFNGYELMNRLVGLVRKYPDEAGDYLQDYDFAKKIIELDERIKYYNENTQSAERDREKEAQEIDRLCSQVSSKYEKIRGLFIRLADLEREKHKYRLQRKYMGKTTYFDLEENWFVDASEKDSVRAFPLSFIDCITLEFDSVQFEIQAKSKFDDERNRYDRNQHLGQTTQYGENKPQYFIVGDDGEKLPALFKTDIIDGIDLSSIIESLDYYEIINESRHNEINNAFFNILTKWQKVATEEELKEKHIQTSIDIGQNEPTPTTLYQDDLDRARAANSSQNCKIPFQIGSSIDRAGFHYYPELRKAYNTILERTRAPRVIPLSKETREKLASELKDKKFPPRPKTNYPY